jgi:hypothetical protein
VCNGPLDLPCRTEYPAHIVIGHCALGVGQKQLVEPQHGIAEPPRGKTAVSDTEVGLGTGVELHHLLGTFDRLVELFFFAEEGAHQFEGCEIVGVYPQHALVAADGLVIVAILDQYEGDVEVYGGVAWVDLHSCQAVLHRLLLLAFLYVDLGQTAVRLCHHLALAQALLEARNGFKLKSAFHVIPTEVETGEKWAGSRLDGLVAEMDGSFKLADLLRPESQLMENMGVVGLKV